MVEAITIFCSETGLSNEDAEAVALASILPAHHPAVVALAPGLWVKIVKHLGCRPRDLVARCAGKLREELIERYQASKVSKIQLVKGILLFI